MSGGYGRDRMCGGSGNDVMSGNHHGDWMFGGPVADVIDSGPGGDFVNVAVGAKRDSVSCGTARDTVVIDQTDLLRESFEDFVRRNSCENVIVRWPASGTLTGRRRLECSGCQRVALSRRS